MIDGVLIFSNILGKELLPAKFFIINEPRNCTDKNAETFYRYGNIGSNQVVQKVVPHPPRGPVTLLLLLLLFLLLFSHYLA